MALDIIIPTKALVHLLGMCGSIVEKRNVIAILSNIKLDVKDNILTITSTDMDLSLQQDLVVDARHGGSITVPAQTFTEIVRKIPDESISLKFIEETDQLYISSANCEFTLSTLPVSDFPVMEDIGISNHISVDAKSFVEILDHTKFAMSNEETRYNLNGVYIHVLPSMQNILVSAATDIHRLSTSSLDIGSNVAPFGVILPRKTVQELLKILKDSSNLSSKLDIYFGQNRVKFVSSNIMLISKLIDGSFPEYSAFVPENNPNKLKINAKNLASVIDRVATITVDKHRAVKIICDENNLEVHASGGEAGGVAHEVIILNEETQYQGEAISIGFNPRYILDALNAVADSMVSVEFSDSSSPILIKADNFPNANFVVMPVKV